MLEAEAVGPTQVAGLPAVMAAVARNKLLVLQIQAAAVVVAAEAMQAALLAARVL